MSTLTTMLALLFLLVFCLLLAAWISDLREQIAVQIRINAQQLEWNDLAKKRIDAL